MKPTQAHLPVTHRLLCPQPPGFTLAAAPTSRELKSLCYWSAPRSNWELLPGCSTVVDREQVFHQCVQVDTWVTQTKANGLRWGGTQVLSTNFQMGNGIGLSFAQYLPVVHPDTSVLIPMSLGCQQKEESTSCFWKLSWSFTMENTFVLYLFQINMNSCILALLLLGFQSLLSWIILRLKASQICPFELAPVAFGHMPIILWVLCFS